jgi:glycosyltransferase involved in cell wall biosynthesis
VGGIVNIRGAKEMVIALEYLRDISGLKLEMAGEFSPDGFDNELRVLLAWSLVNYHGHIGRSEVANLLGGVRAGLVVLHPVINYIDALPVKMFEYMAAGLPVIASDFPLWRQIIEGAQCGLLVDPMCPEAIADAMRWILVHPIEAEAMGRRGRKAVEEKYNWNHEADKLIDLYKKLLAV